MPAQKLVVFCDCDGVLADFTGHVIAALKKLGIHYTIEDMTDYSIVKNLDPKHKRHFEQLPRQKEWCMTIPRYPGAQQFAKDIVAQGHKLHLVTHFWDDSPHWSVTRPQWIESFLSSPQLRDVEWTQASPEERLAMPFDVLIDDRLETVNQCQKTCLLMNRPWNQGRTNKNVYRISGYPEALQLLATFTPR